MLDGHDQMELQLLNTRRKYIVRLSQALNIFARGYVCSLWFIVVFKDLCFNQPAIILSFFKDIYII